MNNLLNVKEASELLNVPEGTMNRWRTEKERKGPPFYKAEGRVLYSADDIQKWLDKNKVG